MESLAAAAAGLVAVPVGFFTGYPYAILNWPPFLEHLGRMGAYAGTREFDPVARFNHIVGYSSESGFGLPFTIVVGIALVYFIHRRRAEELLAVDCHRRIVRDARAHGASILRPLFAPDSASRARSWPGAF